jgi:hypothetical protein
MSPAWKCSDLFRSVLTGVCVAWLLACATRAQEPAPKPEGPPKRLIEQEPFDQITVKDAAGVPTTFKIMPLDEKALPGRVKPEKLPAAPLNIRLVDRPDEMRQVAWSAIKLELFEELVLAEAMQLVADRKTDLAYDNFDFLVRNYPKAPGLDEAMQTFLFVDAGRLYGEKRYTEALAVLEELYRQNKDFRYKTETATVTAALNGVFDKILEDYFSRQSYAPARTLLARWDKTYKTARLPNIAKWQGIFAQRAGEKRDEARALLEDGKGRAARDAARQMVDVWPTVDGGRELIAEIARRHPLVMVGVTRPATRSDTGDLYNSSARRTGRLLQRNLVEYAGQGPEGGRYVCPLGKIELSEDGKQLLFHLQKAPAGGALPNLTGYDVSRRLLSLANPASPDYLPAWSRLMAGADVQGVMDVVVDFRRPYVSPQALLQVPLVEFSGSSEPAGPYLRGESSGAETRFTPNPRYPNRAAPRAEIVERQFETPSKALTALRRGEVDAIDRLFPAEVPRLKDDPQILVGRYELPTVHLLIPNAKRPYLANRTFRRAILYAIDRQAILDQGLLGGAKLTGCQVVSGPFSAGVSDNDAGAYAYNRRVEPRPWDPRLAILLIQLAEQELANLAKDKNETPPSRPKLVLAHPAGEVPRIACRAIALQLKLVGLVCELRELPPGETEDAKEEYDLLYVEAALPEPAIDARRLLGTGGPAIAGGSHVAFALRQLEAAQSWQEARRRLLELHTMTHDEVSILPLWQIVEHYAHHASLRGLGDKAAALYQDVEQWQIVPREIKP